MWNYNYTYSYPNELYHYGVLGMKWGVRRYQNPDGSLTSKGKKRYAHNSENTNNENKTKTKNAFDKKKAIKIGVAVVGTALLTYGAYKVYKGNINFSLKVDDSTGLPIMKNKEKLSEAIHKVNNGAETVHNGRSMNCGNCVIAADLRAKGYDVQAKENAIPVAKTKLGELYNGLSSNSFASLSSSDVIDIEHNTKPYSIERSNKVKKALINAINDSYNEDSSGCIAFSHMNGGHFISWSKKGNTVEFYNPQNPKVGMPEIFSTFKHKTHPNEELEIIRLDNLTPNRDTIKEALDFKGNDTILSDNTIIKGKNFIMKRLK